MDALRTSDSQFIGVQISRGRLVLRAGGYVLTFRNGGPSRSEQITPAPTPTATKAVERIYAPDVQGDDAAAAQSALRSVGLKVRLAYVASKVVGPGKVVAQSPPASRQVPLGSVVTLKVSRYTSGNACADQRLRLTAETLSGETGEHGLIFTIANAGPVPCMLTGYPSVRVVNGTTTLPFHYRDGGRYVSKRPPRTVVLQPGGGAAYFVIAKYTCELRTVLTGHTLRIQLPGGHVTHKLPLRYPGEFDTCAGGGSTDMGNRFDVSPVTADLRHAFPTR
jgi:hypothetical protein